MEEFDWLTCNLQHVTLANKKNDDSNSHRLDVLPFQRKHFCDRFRNVSLGHKSGSTVVGFCRFFVTLVYPFFFMSVFVGFFSVRFCFTSNKHFPKTLLQ